MEEENFIDKFDLSEQEIADICKHYESVSAFCTKYVRFLSGDKGEKVKMPKSISNRVVNYFDLSNAYSVGECSGYAYLVADIFKLEPGFATFFPLEEYVNKAIEDSLSEQDKDIIRNLYGLNVRKKTLQELAKEYHTNQDEIITLKQRSVRRLAAGKKNSQLQLLGRNIVKRNELEEFIKGVLNPEDAFESFDYDRISDKKCNLLYHIIEKEISEFIFDDDLSYVLDVFRLKEKIKKSILSSEDKQKLLALVEEKVSDFVQSRNVNIKNNFRLKIECVQLGKAGGRKVKDLAKYIINSGLSQEEIDIYLKQLPNYSDVEEANKYRKNIHMRIRFPQKELMVDSLETSKKVIEACRKSGLYSVGQIVAFSRNELRRIGAMRKLYVDDVLDAIEKLGYDIPEDEDISLEAYNQEKIYDNNYYQMVEEIQNSEFEKETKDSMISFILIETIKKLQDEYERLSRIICTYRDVFNTHTTLKMETADECKYRRKVKEAEVKINAVKSELDMLTR